MYNIKVGRCIDRATIVQLDEILPFYIISDNMRSLKYFCISPPIRLFQKCKHLPVPIVWHKCDAIGVYELLRH